MTLTSFYFFVFLIVTLLAYYLVKPLQKYILLAASVYFYLQVSAYDWKVMGGLMLGMVAVTYLGALGIEKTAGKIRTLILGVCITVIIAALFLLKYAFNLFSVFVSLFHWQADISWLQFAAVIGISYYALSAMGYLVDVYWENYGAERNPVNVGLFIFFFPQLISGPFTRYSEMREQFDTRHTLDYDQITHGMRRMAWGYFKKLVISERFGLVVSAVYTNYGDHSMVGIVGATLCYAIQLYTDFSGCMDIIMGCAQMFGITLPENFRAPFFSESIQEFWQRWHITLGTWFKDYFMYPVQKSKPIQKAGKAIKKVIGKKKGKRAPFYLSMLLLWILIGIWHGATTYYFVASAGIPCILLILSDLCQPLFAKLVQILRINVACASWHWFRRVRTLLLVCLCWFVVCSGSMENVGLILQHMVTHPWSYMTFGGFLELYGMKALDVLVMAAGLVLLYITDRCIYEGTTVFKVMDQQNYLIRVAIIYVELLTILFLGMVGSSAFIYFQF